MQRVLVFARQRISVHIPVRSRVLCVTATRRTVVRKLERVTNLFKRDEIFKVFRGLTSR